MKKDEPYVPLSERLNQDVWHDNFVPKYSGLANAKPNGVVFVGTWLIFAPSLLYCVAVALDALIGGEPLAIRIVQFVGSGLVTILFAVILYQQTQRFLTYEEPDDTDDTDETD